MIGPSSLRSPWLNSCTVWSALQEFTKGRREAYLGAFVAGVPILPYTESTALYHAHLWAELASAGKMIGLYDLIVAATALEHGTAIATFNRRHFSRVPGLTIIQPTIPGQ